MYAIMGGLGFASVENVVLGRFLEGPELWGRIVASPLTHALFASIWGYALAVDCLTKRRSWRQLTGLAAAAFLHGVYDFGVLSPGTSRFVVAGLILTLWILFFVMLAKLLKRSPCRSENED